MNDREALLVSLHAEACRLANLRSKAKGAEKRALTVAMNAAYEAHRAALRSR